MISENLAEDPDALSQQVKGLPREEEIFWTHLVSKIIGKNINHGLNIEELARGLKILRNKVSQSNFCFW